MERKYTFYRDENYKPEIVDRRLTVKELRELGAIKAAYCNVDANGARDYVDVILR